MSAVRNLSWVVTLDITVEGGMGKLKLEQAG